MRTFLRHIFLVLLTAASFLTAFADESKDFPPVPNPPRLVNDMAGMMTASEQEQLEAKLLEYEKSSSTQITIVTIQSIGAYEPSQYGVELFNRWGLGQKSKNNGVLIFASRDDHKINITTGYGIEGSLPDAVCGRIIRNEMVPAFKQGNYFAGFSNAADAVIAATKGEYQADEQQPDKRHKAPGSIVLIIIILIVVWIFSRRGGGGGGNYMSGRGARDFMTGAILGNLLGRGGRGWGGGGDWGGGGGWGGGSGGFGGFGGGSSGGGGASGSW